GGLVKSTETPLSGAVPLAEAAPSLPNLEGLKGDGLVLGGNGGLTVLVQDLSQSSIRNLVVNTANDRTIVQNTAVTLAIPNLLDLQQAMSAEQMRSSINDALRTGLLNSVRQ